MLSTPLICCSIGVATDCSTVCASAPGYVAFTWISGGAMFGNCAVGRLSIATTPMMTIRIAITIATIGRLMKKFAMKLSALRSLRGCLRIDQHAFFDLLLALDDNLLSGIQSFGDDPLLTDTVADFHRTNAGFLVVSDRNNRV